MTNASGLHRPTPVAVTILAGFLGAGKTTLLNRILNSPHGRRIGVMINDFGALNIDAQLVTNVDDEMTISLENGCICCNIRDDLLDQTLKLLRREQPPEYIIVEASGVSDPLAIAQTFSIPELTPVLYLDSVITLVDAEQFPQLQGEYARLAHVQAAVADVIIVNKADLVTVEHLAALKHDLSNIHPRIIEATHGEVPLDLLIGINHRAFALESHFEHSAPHSAMFDSWSWSSEEALSGKALHRILRQLPSGILRAKGILNLQETPDSRMILQVVGSRLSLSPGADWDQESPHSQIVAISMAGTVNFNELGAKFGRTTTTASLLR